MHPVSVQNPADHADEIDIRHVWRILKRRRRAIFGSVVLAVACGAALAFHLPPSYEATALVRVDERAARLPELTLLAGVQGGTEVGTEIEVLRSRTLARLVVDSLDLQVRLSAPREVRRSEVLSRIEVAPGAGPAEYQFVRGADGRFAVMETGTDRTIGRFAPGEVVPLEGARVELARSAGRHEEIAVEIMRHDFAVEHLEEALEVDRISREANIIRIRHRDRDPELARDVPNALAAVFVSLRQGVQKTEARSTAHFLRQQLDTLAVQLATAEDELRRFREARGVVDLQVEGSSQVGHLAQMQADRNALEAERSALAAALRDAEVSAGSEGLGAPSPYRRLIAFPTLMRNQTASEILSSLTRLEDQRTGLISR